MDKSSSSFNDHEEEYTVINDEEMSAPSRPIPENSNVAQASNPSDGRKKIILFILFIVVLVVLYKLYEVFLTTRPSIKEKATLPAAVKMVEPSKPAPLVSVPATLESSSASVTVNKSPTDELLAPSTKTDETLDKKIAALTEVVQHNQQNADNLQQEISGLSNAISDIQNNIANLTQNMENLKSTLAVQQKKSEISVEKKMHTKKISSHKHHDVTSTTSVYYARAMIQGRAWLVTSEGNIFTVSVGDQLPGYGKITAIEPDNGLIMTNSGRVITYHSQDK